MKKGNIEIEYDTNALAAYDIVIGLLDSLGVEWKIVSDDDAETIVIEYNTEQE